MTVETGKRSREDDGPDVGPAPPPPGAVDSDNDDDAPMPGPAGPMPPKPKKQKSLPFEQVYLDSLPSAQMYEKSYMHRDHVTFVAVTPGTDFFITASHDGHLKFWKKRFEGVEFVKHFRSHAGPILGLSVSADGLYCATIGADRSVKVYDVVNFDMTLMIRTQFVPTACEFVYRKGEAQQKIAVGAPDGAIHVYDGASGDQTPVHTLELHRAAVRCIKYNAAKRCVISSDDKGVIEYWSPATYEAPTPDEVDFRFKLDTDLYHMAKAKTKALSLEVSHDGEQFSTMGPDRRVRVFRFGTGKLRCVIDETLESANDVQRAGADAYKLEDIDFGRRLAVEREMGNNPDLEIGFPNAVFDQSGHFLLYSTLLGVKVVNLVTSRCARIIGKVENTERFMRLAMFQGVPQKDKRARGSGKDTKQTAEKDPTLVCSAFHKTRLYLFTSREPEDGDDAAGGRDVFNEKPLADERVSAASLVPTASTSLARSAVIHTTVGDIHVQMFPDACPKTCENFTTHSRNGYYDNIIFHRIIKGFMLQTGDPLGDGTGGVSIWGGEFEDEITRDLRHDRPYTVSMANAGPNTNGSQFFITTTATPWLNGKHVVFGSVVEGLDVVKKIERTPTARGDRPVKDVTVTESGELPLA